MEVLEILKKKDPLVVKNLNPQNESDFLESSTAELKNSYPQKFSIRFNPHLDKKNPLVPKGLIIFGQVYAGSQL